MSFNSFSTTPTVLGEKARFTGPGSHNPVASVFNAPGRARPLLVPPGPVRDALLKLMRSNLLSDSEVPPTVANELRANGIELAEGHGRIGLVSKVTHEGDYVRA
jgi:hypothetical protein